MDERDKSEPTALAWTPDDVMERGTREFQENFPDLWEKWLEWLRKEDPND